MTPRIDDPKQGVSQADVYQLMAYGQLYDCPNVMLLYPHHADLPLDPIRQRYSIGARDSDETFFVATLDLAGSHRGHRTALRDLISECLIAAAALEAPNSAGPASTAASVFASA